MELYPIAGKKLVTAAEAAGLKTSRIPTLLVEGDNRPGLGHAIAEAIAAANINLDFIVAQVIGRRYSAAIGFESPQDAKKGRGPHQESGGSQTQIKHRWRGLRALYHGRVAPVSQTLIPECRGRLRIRCHQLQLFGHFQKIVFQISMRIRLRRPDLTAGEAL